MKVLHLMTGGGVGGIQTLLRQYATYSKIDNVFIFAYGNGPCCDELEKDGIHIYRVAEYSGLAKFNHILKIIKNERPDVIVEHFCAPFLRLVLLYFKHFTKGNIKTVIYQHHDASLDGDNASRLKRKINRWIDGRACRDVDSIIAISSFVKNSICKNYDIIPNKIKVIYNGIMLDRFNTNEHQRNELIYVGRLVEGKGVQLVLNSLKDIKHEYHFNIIGDGPYRSSLEEIVNKNKMNDKVTFWGAQKEPSEFINQASIFVHMPIFEEGFGITIVEAMAAGLTVITAYSGGISEIVIDKVNGYLIEKSNEKEISEIIEKVLKEYDSNENVCIRNQAVVDAKQYAIENFTEKLDRAWIQNETI